MKIKELNNYDVRLMRYTYNAEEKRTDRKLLGTFSVLLGPSDKTLEMLTADEAEELNQYLEKREIERDHEHKDRLVKRLPESLIDVASHINNGHCSDKLADQDYVDSLIDGLDELKKTLRKNGVKITKKKADKEKKPSSSEPEFPFPELGGEE